MFDHLESLLDYTFNLSLQNITLLPNLVSPIIHLLGENKTKNEPPHDKTNIWYVCLGQPGHPCSLISLHNELSG